MEPEPLQPQSPSQFQVHCKSSGLAACGTALILSTAVAPARLCTNWAGAMCLLPQPPSKALLQLPSSRSCIHFRSILVHRVKQNSGKQACCSAIIGRTPLKQSFREFGHCQSVWLLPAEQERCILRGIYYNISGGLDDSNHMNLE